MNILIIEDEKFLADKIGGVFRSEAISNRVRVLYSYREFLQESPVLRSYDLIITDLKLGTSYDDFEGYEIIRTIRERGLITPIVVISGFDDVNKLQRAFDLWANDYLIKPIRLKELEVRIMNWFRNYYLSKITFHGNVCDYHGLSYDFWKHEFSFRCKPIQLTKKSKYLLSIFFSNPGKLICDEFLIDKLWGDICLVTDRPIRVNILRLKQALEPFGIDSWISNIHGEWYIFLAPKP